MDNMDLEVPAGAAQPAAGANLVVKLPAFWPSNPVAWFANADGQFALRGITCQRVKYYNTLSVLPEATVNLIADLVETEEVPQDAYTQLKARLYGAHQLSDYARVEQLFALPTLGDRKPSELLAEMTRICPRGQENNLFFTYCFLHRLPREIRVLLADVDHADRRALAVRADQIWAHNTKYSHDAAVAAVEAVPEPAAVAAVAANNRQRGGGGRGGRGGRANGNRGRGSGQRGGATGGSGVAAPLTPSDNARAGSDLCHYHWSFGERAHKCVAPCSWQGN
jgi:uncharacterized membrane protein YgcG